MNNIKTNALRIAELMGWRYNPIFQQNTLDCNTYFADAVKISSNDELIELYSNYQGLMPIVFECNNSHFSVIQVAHLYRRNYILFVDVNDCTSNDPVYYTTEPEFIEALQMACIKYLELKNG